MSSLEWFDVATHIFIIPTLYVAFKHIKEFLVVCFVLIGTLLFSLIYHVCLAGGSQCADVKNWQQKDHLWAEFNVPMIAVYLNISCSETTNGFVLLLWFVINMYLQSTEFLPKLSMLVAIVYGFCNLFFFFKRWNRMLLLWFVILSFFGCLCFYLDSDETYVITHGFWHIAIFIAEAIALQMIHKAKIKCVTEVDQTPTL